MKFIRIALAIVVGCLSIISCVKNEPFIAPYSVPKTYDFDNKDSATKARMIMLYGLKNYLLSGVNKQLDGALADSLWQNKDSSFTEEMVPDYVYSHHILNRMSSINLANDTENPDSLKAFIESAVNVSASYNVAGSNGVAGWQMLSTPTSSKRLFNSRGVEYIEVWEKAMLGSMALVSINYYLINAGTTNSGYWDLAYNYSGLPKDYDPSFNYDLPPLKADRPLGVGALFSNPSLIQIGTKIFEDFKRGRVAMNAFDNRMVNIAKDSLLINIEKAFALSAITYLNAAMNGGNTADKLYTLSQAMGTIIALKYRLTEDLLDEPTYWMLRGKMDTSFYTLIQEPGFTTIKQVRDALATSYGFNN